MYLAQGPQRSDAGEARTSGPSVSSQALYHLANALPLFPLIYLNRKPFKIVSAESDIIQFVKNVNKVTIYITWGNCVSPAPQGRETNCFPPRICLSVRLSVHHKIVSALPLDNL